jgi:hypothetical protein
MKQSLFLVLQRPWPAQSEFIQQQKVGDLIDLAQQLDDFHSKTAQFQIEVLDRIRRLIENGEQGQQDPRKMEENGVSKWDTIVRLMKNTGLLGAFWRKMLAGKEGNQHPMSGSVVARALQNKERIKERK